MVQPASKRLVTEATVASHVAAQVTTPGTATATALSATYGASATPLKTAFAKQSGSILGGVVVAAGDSITQSDETATLDGNVWARHMCHLSQGALTLKKNTAVAGRTSANILAGIQAEVISQNPDIVTLLVGTNDARSSVPLATYAANVIAIVSAIQAAGGRPVLGTVPPQGTAGMDIPAAPIVNVKTTGGTLPAGDYSYRIVARNGSASAGFGESLVSPRTTVNIASGTTNSIEIIAPPVAGVVTYDLYGRTAFAEKFLTANPGSWSGVPNRRFLDTGAYALGASPVGANTSAVAFNGTIHGFINQYNAWLREYCAANRILLIDFYNLLVDDASDLFQKKYTFDGIHPTGLGQAAMGKLAWAAVSAIVAPTADRLTKSDIDATSLISNELFKNSLAGSWTLADPSATGASIAAAVTAGYKGKALVTTAPGVGTVTVNSLAVTGGYVAGDKVRVGARFAVEGAEAGQGWYRLMLLRQPGNIVLAEMNIAGADLGPGVWEKEVVVTTGTTQLAVFAEHKAGSLTAKLGEVTLRNLTNLGL